MLGHWNKDAGRQSHVEDSVSLLAILLNLLDVLVKLLEGLILVILSREICADGAELIQLFLHIFSWCLYVGSDSLEVFGMVHLGSSISDDLDVLWQEFVSELVFGKHVEIAVRKALRSYQAK
jgi:hypothetical protein